MCETQREERREKREEKREKKEKKRGGKHLPSTFQIPKLLEGLIVRTILLSAFSDISMMATLASAPLLRRTFLVESPKGAPSI